jgi:flagellar biosynthetic protein FliR
MKLDDWVIANIQLFTLVFFRVLSVCLIAPIFGNRAMPMQLKAGFGFFFALALTPLVMRMRPPALHAWSALPLLVIQEMSVGFMIGLISSLLFSATHLSGEMLGQHMGFGMARVIDPDFGDELSVVAEFENLVALMLFLAISGHHLLVLALCDSFEIVGIGGVRCDSSIATELIRVTARIFPVAIKITAPAFVILIVTTVVEGLVARCVPQMNVLIVGLPLKIAVGLIGLAACVPMFSYIFEKMLRLTTGDTYMMLEHLR